MNLILSSKKYKKNLNSVNALITCESVKFNIFDDVQTKKTTMKAKTDLHSVLLKMSHPL